MNKIYKLVKVPKSGVISRTIVAGVLASILSFGAIMPVNAASTNSIGEVTAFSKDSNPAGYLLCDGRAVSRIQYAKLFAEIGTKYGAGDGSTTFNLPNLTNRFIEGSTSAGNYIEAGLPNITGSFSGGDIEAIWDLGNSTGAFSVIKENTTNVRDGSESDLNTVGVTFDASKSNSIYGKSTTVQPNALTMRYFIKATDNVDVDDNLHVKGTTQLDKATTIGTSSANANLTVNGNESVSGTITSTGKITSKDGVAAGGKVTGVTAGTADTDALNVKQLKDEVKIADNGNYVKTTQTTAQNLSALDTQAKANATAISNEVTARTNADTALSNRIGTLAANGNYITTTNSAAQNLKALDDKIGSAASANGQIGALNEDGEYIQKNNNVSQNLAALDNAIDDVVNSGLQFGANSGDDVTNKIGSKVSIIGGGTKADNEYDSKNIKTIIVQDENGNTQIEIDLDKNPEFASILTEGDANIGGKLNVDGDTHLKSNLQVDGDTNLSGNTTIEKDLTVKGDSNLEGNTHVYQNLQVDGDTNISGNTTIEKDLTVKGDSNLEGNAHVYQNLQVDGDTNISGNTTIEKNLTVEGDSNLKGDAHIYQNLQVDGDTNLSGNTTIEKDLEVLGNSNIHGNGRYGGDLTVEGDSNLKGNAHVGKNLQVDGDANVGGTLTADKVVTNDIQLPSGSLNRRMDNMDTRIDKVGAGAAALAGLQYAEFDPGSKFSMAMGMGHYKGKTAAAVGGQYHFSRNVSMNLAGTIGNGENMVSAGLTFRFGTPRSKYQKDNDALRAENDMLNKRLKAVEKKIQSLSLITEKRAAFPDVEKSHWANKAVETLHGNGFVQGYPDGEFKGDRQMTRYEYAEMLYNALSKGAKVDQAQLEEYAPELHKINAERVRGNKPKNDKKSSQGITTTTVQQDADTQAFGQAYNANHPR